MPGKWKLALSSRRPIAVQRKLEFAVETERRERLFKRLIATATALVFLGLVGGTRTGRFAAFTLTARATGGHQLDGRASAGSRLEQKRMHAERLRNAAKARESLAKLAAPGSATDKFLRAAGMDAASAVLRWGNVDRSILLSSAVFEPDDDRAYRLKPCVRSVWVIGLSLRDALAMFLIPDTPEARNLAATVGGKVVPESVQTTNSWGCRGSEPDANAPVRVLVLGDSMMQGTLVGDADTPPAKLEDCLREALKTQVTVLNTGHLGYSIEQYEQTFRAFGERFQPHFVIVSIYVNDFGDMNNPANLAEGEYWLDRIADSCVSRGWPFLVVLAADEFELIGPRRADRLQIELSRMIKYSNTKYVDTTVAFTERLLRLKNDAARKGEPVIDPLYNLHLMGDRHYSPMGAALWAQVVARRMLLVWDGLALSGVACPEPVLKHAANATSPDAGRKERGVGPTLLSANEVGPTLLSANEVGPTLLSANEVGPTLLSANL